MHAVLDLHDESGEQQRLDVGAHEIPLDHVEARLAVEHVRVLECLRALVDTI